MPLPVSVPVGTVAGRYYGPDGSDAVGTAYFLLLNEIEVPDDADGVVIPLMTKVNITAGVLNVTLPAGFYNARVKLGDWYEKAVVVEVETGVALNLPDAIGVVPPEELLTPVRSVEGILPDSSGNIDLPGGGGGGVTDHGDLTGLADDDHTQYLNNTRGDVRYYTKAQVDTSLAGKANTSHTHAIADVTSLQTALDGKSDTGHTHTIANVTGLQAAIDSKAPVASPTFAGTVTAPRVITPVVALTDAATITTDASLGNQFRVTLGGNRTLGNPTNPTDGQKAMWEIIQDSTGSRTLTLGSDFALGTDVSSVTLTTTANKRDFLGAVYNSTAAKWFVVAFVKGY